MKNARVLKTKNQETDDKKTTLSYLAFQFILNMLRAQAEYHRAVYLQTLLRI